MALAELDHTLVADTLGDCEPGIHADPVHLWDLARGAAVGRYVVLERLGAGGMGVVYAAWDPQLDRKLALKLLRHAPGDSGAERGSARLLREAQALARLRHPNVVAVHDVGTFTGQVFVAMEYIDGQTLRAWLGATDRRHEEILAVFLAAGRGLAAAHAAGLIHRDFKPDNVMIDARGRVCVLDFGLAREAGAETESKTEVETEFKVETESELSAPPSPRERFERPTHMGSSSVPSLTRTGALLGTPAYMAPEQFDAGAEINARADQFSFCVALWEALNAERPFPGNTVLSAMDAQLSEQLRPFRRDDVPASARAALRRGLSLEPAARFAELSELLAALESMSSPRRRRVVSGIAGLTLAGIVGLALGRGAGSDAQAAARDCSQVGDSLAQLWGPERKQTIAGAFAATQLPYAPQTFSQVSTRLDSWASAWRSARVDACTAHFIEERESLARFELRVACLQRERNGLARLLDTLAEAGPEAVEHASAAVNALPPVEQCADPRRLGAELREPEDPFVRLELVELRAELDRALALARLTRVAEAASVFSALEQAAERLDFAPFTAEVHVARARHLRAMARAPGPLADDALVALLAAREGQTPGLEVESLAMLALAAARTGQRDEAERWLRVGEVLAATLDRQPLTQLLVRTRAAADELAGDWSLAEPGYRAAAAFVERTHGPDSLEYGRAALELGRLLTNRGEAEVALPLLERGLAIVARELGETHPELAQIHADLGLAHTELGQLDAALGRFDQAATLARELDGEFAPLNLQMLSYSSISLTELGRCGEARTRLTHRAELAERRDGRESTAWAHAALRLAWSCAWSHPEAIELLHESLAVRERARGRDKAWVSASLNLGFAYYVRGELSVARAHFELARARLESLEYSEGQTRWWDPRDQYEIADALLDFEAGESQALVRLFELRDRIDPHEMIGPYGLIVAALAGELDPRGLGG